jgi:hypothetical protein
MRIATLVALAFGLNACSGERYFTDRELQTLTLSSGRQVDVFHSGLVEKENGQSWHFEYHTQIHDDPLDQCDEIDEIWNDIRPTAEAADVNLVEIDMVDPRLKIRSLWPPVVTTVDFTGLFYARSEGGPWEQYGFAICQSVLRERASDTK